jgi:uncharacterized spore protein YtfJ
MKEIKNEDKENFVEGLAQKLGITANAKYIYAEPVERDGVTVIPVAKAAYAFGGGSGKNEDEEGGGGGGGVMLTPVGYIEIKSGQTRFCPNRDWISLLPMMAVTVPLIFAGVLGIKRLLKRT